MQNLNWTQFLSNFECRFHDSFNVVVLRIIFKFCQIFMNTLSKGMSTKVATIQTWNLCSIWQELCTIQTDLRKIQANSVTPLSCRCHGRETRFDWGERKDSESESASKKKDSEVSFSVSELKSKSITVIALIAALGSKEESPSSKISVN